jgi:Mg2+ and Co2+ transporter CorA
MNPSGTPLSESLTFAVMELESLIKSQQAILNTLAKRLNENSINSTDTGLLRVRLSTIKTLVDAMDALIGEKSLLQSSWEYQFHLSRQVEEERTAEFAPHPPLSEPKGV